MTNEQDQSKAEQAARSALDQNLQELPEDITSALAAARKKAMQAAAETSGPSESDKRKPTANVYSIHRTRVIWSGAIAASITALALTLALQPPGAVAPVEADYLLTLAELESLDDTEWALVQDLEFALWLSELDEGAFATEPQG